MKVIKPFKFIFTTKFAYSKFWDVISNDVDVVLCKWSIYQGH